LSAAPFGRFQKDKNVFHSLTGFELRNKEKYSLTRCLYFVS